jgi:anti-anti-sigma factor
MSERPQLEARLDHLPRALVVHLRGEIDLANAESLRHEVLAVAGRHTVPTVIVEVGEVEYLDSSGLELLFLLARELGEREQALVAVVPPRSPASRTLEVAGLDRLYPVHADLDGALGATDDRTAR